MNFSEFTLLLVEDDPNDIRLIQRALTKANLVNPLRIVRDGDEALHYLSGQGEHTDRKRHPLPSLILLDIKLPKRSGLEVLEWVRNQSDLKRIPVIMLTSSQETADINRAYELGANSYIIKPVGCDGLLEMVKGIGAYWMILNRTPAGPAGRADTTAAVPAASGGGVLIVDGDVDFLRAVTEGLRRRIPPLAADTAGAASDALERIARTGYDAVVVDRGVPDLDALDFLRRAQGLRPGLPVFVLVEGEDPEFTGRALAAGGRAVLRKQVRLDQFTDLLHRSLQAQKIAQRVQERTEAAAHAHEEGAPPARANGGWKGDTEILGPQRHFSPTQWDLVRAAGDVKVLDDLLTIYWKPLYFFVRQRGYDNETAKDIVQDFLTTVVEDGVISRADPARGRFRTFLLAALTNFLKDWTKASSRMKRGGGRPVFSLDFGAGEREYSREATSGETPETLLNRAWARSLLDRCLRELKGEPSHLKAFELQMKGMDYRAIAEETRLSESAARTAVHRLRGQLRDVLVSHIGRTAGSEDDLETELAEFLSLLQ